MRISTLLTVLVLTTPVVAQEPATVIAQAELERRIASAVDSLAAVDEFSGIVVLGRRGVPVFVKTAGVADRETRAPITVETAFNIGSINKVFTATAIRQLAAQGKLHLDSTLAAAWPDYPNADVARRVTIQQILTHRSGIGGDIFAAPPGGTRHDLRQIRDFLPLFVARPLDFEPGSRQQYSNAGYIVLGALVERLSGMDYHEYIRRNVTEPAGMTRTMHLHVDSLPAKTARGYTGSAHARTLNTATLPGRGSSAGGGYSTATDLLKFVQALRERRIPSGSPPGIGAAGGAPGLNAVVEGAMPGGYDLVVLTNLDPPAASRMARMIRGWLGAAD